MPDTSMLCIEGNTSSVNMAIVTTFFITELD